MLSEPRPSRATAVGRLDTERALATLGTSRLTGMGAGLLALRTPELTAAVRPLLARFTHRRPPE